MTANLIRYSILQDDTCSYCGRSAEIYALPDGNDVVCGCASCDAYNEEIEMDVQLDIYLTRTEREGEEFLQGS
jgi:hypothetical protein